LSKISFSCNAESAEIKNDQRGNECRRQTNDIKRLARDIGFHPVDQTHSAKLAGEVDLSPSGDDGLVPHQKKHKHDVLAV
jgi:hypothetical protein